MAIQRVELHNFTAFEHLDLAFVPGVNVIIGENGTGKTHLLKVIYAVIKAAEEYDAAPHLVAFDLSRPLVEVFRPAEAEHPPAGPITPVQRRAERLRRTESTGAGLPPLLVETDRYTCRSAPLGYLASLEFPDPSRKAGAGPIFLVSRDVLAMYEGFVAAYERRELAFDRTYFDLCIALSGTPLRSTPEVVERIDALVGGAFVEHKGRFELDARRGPRLEAQLVGEGLRKLGALGRLLRNGSITQGTTLLWDEPEAGLNPSLVTQVADVLVALAAWGVQVIVATHDYLLSRRLSLLTEYRRTHQPIRFFGLHRLEPGGPVSPESGETLAALSHNPILDEFTRQYDFERELFYAGEENEASA